MKVIVYTEFGLQWEKEHAVLFKPSGAVVGKPV
jgi:hypothetical protein